MKKLLGLLSVVAGAAIVGTTFAAWAVTDKADPFSVKVTPGGSTIDQTTAVTLKYGSTFTVGNITSLSADKARLAAEVGLAIESSGEAYEGKFTVELEDLSSGKGENDAKLIDNLAVKVFSKKDITIEYNADKEISTDYSAKTPDLKIDFGAQTKKAEKKYTVTKDAEYVIYVVVELKEGLDPSDLAEIETDYVRITMDWGKGSDEDKESSVIYFKGLKDADYYCYAWGTSGNPNAQWPGVKMEKETDLDDTFALFAYNLGTQFNKVIFTNGIDEGDQAWKTADLDVNGEIRENTPCYDGTNWMAKPAKSDLTAAYYLVGSFNEWSASDEYAMEYNENGGDPFYFINNVNLAKDASLKVMDAAGKNYYSSSDYFGGETIKAHLDGDGNIVVEEAGAYNVRYYLSGSNGNFVILDHAA